jgi:Ca2+-binding EF-hand superfamily protein
MPRFHRESLERTRARKAYEKELKRTLESWDANGDGVLQADEVRAMLEAHRPEGMKGHVSLNMALKCMRYGGETSEPIVTSNEVPEVVAMFRANASSDEHIRKVFSTFDVDHNGELDKLELLDLLNTLNADIPCTPKDVRRVLKRCDFDKVWFARRVASSPPSPPAGAATTDDTARPPPLTPPPLPFQDGHIEKDEIIAAVSYWYHVAADRQAEILVASEGWCCWCYSCPMLAHRPVYPRERARRNYELNPEQEMLRMQAARRKMAEEEAAKEEVEAAKRKKRIESASVGGAPVEYHKPAAKSSKADFKRRAHDDDHAGRNAALDLVEGGAKSSVA